MKSINENELEEIFTKIKDDNEEAFKELYSKYNSLVYRIAFTILKNKEDSEDIVQVVFLKISRLDIEKLPTKKISSWLYSVTKNEAISLIRKKREIIDLDAIYEVENTENEVENMIDTIEFNRLITGLGIKEKEIVTLKVLANLSFKEISQLLGEPESTIKWRYYTSMNTLKLLLSNVAMFALTFVIGLTKLFNTKQKNHEQSKGTKSQNNHLAVEEDYETIINTDKSLNTDMYTETSKIIENEESIYIGILSFSGIFLILAIIFTIIFIKRKKNVKKIKRTI